MSTEARLCPCCGEETRRAFSTAPILHLLNLIRDAADVFEGMMGYDDMPEVVEWLERARREVPRSAGGVSDDADAWTKRLEEKVLQVAITADMWACGECSPEFALRSIRREIEAVVKKITEDVTVVGGSGPQA